MVDNLAMLWQGKWANNAGQLARHAEATYVAYGAIFVYMQAEAPGFHEILGRSKSTATAFPCCMTLLALAACGPQPLDTFVQSGQTSRPLP